MTFGWCSLEVSLGGLWQEWLPWRQWNDKLYGGGSNENGKWGEWQRVSKTTHCFNHLLKIFIEFSTAVLSSLIHGSERRQKINKGKGGEVWVKQAQASKSPLQVESHRTMFSFPIKGVVTTCVKLCQPEKLIRDSQPQLLLEADHVAVST